MSEAILIALMILMGVVLIGETYDQVLAAYRDWKRYK